MIKKRNILGVDYGRKKIGLALAVGLLAEPYKVIRYKNIDEAIVKLEEVIVKNEIDDVVLGISEGKMAMETKDFAMKLKVKINKSIFFQDETLSTHTVNVIAGKLRMGWKKKKDFEDAFAAAIILQDYLDLKGKF